jgi:hypothetical protein
MSDTPLIPAPLYGLRTWSVAVDAHGELLTGSFDRTPWPDGGAWLEATCDRGEGHAAPDPDCACGIHAWHPNRAGARRVLASRFDVPGVVEATGAVQVHDEGFRAQRARPYALVALPGRNAKLVARLADRYRAEMVEVAGADELVAWCRERGLGLDDAVVDGLVGTAGPERRRRRRKDAAGIAAALAVAGALLALGGAFASGPPSPNGVSGRTGCVIPPRHQTCPQDDPGLRTTTDAPGPTPAPSDHR